MHTQLVYSEEAYLKDVDGLINVYLRKIRASGMAFGAPGFLQKFSEYAEALQTVCGAFLTMLQQRQGEAVVVARIDDVVAMHVESMATKFYDYCEVALETRAVLSEQSSDMSAFLIGITNSTESRGLTMDAFTLAPVQRMIRYPMLIEEVRMRCRVHTGAFVCFRAGCLSLCMLIEEVRMGLLKPQILLLSEKSILR